MESSTGPVMNWVAPVGRGPAAPRLPGTAQPCSDSSHVTLSHQGEQTAPCLASWLPTLASRPRARASVSHAGPGRGGDGLREKCSPHWSPARAKAGRKLGLSLDEARGVHPRQGAESLQVGTAASVLMVASKLDPPWLPPPVRTMGRPWPPD